MKYILDTSAVIAFFFGENGHENVERILLSPGCCIHSVNWTELYYKMHNKGGEKAAKMAVNGLRELGVSVTDISGEDFLLRVAEIKIAHSALSLGDCYAIGLSEWLKGTVVTSDKEFSKATAYTKIKQIR